jgi:CDP-diacylglycerol--glycerol-3-phosphate 3-phosphatidyltransferase
MNFPNLLTLLRIFLVPILAAAMVQENFRFFIGRTVISNDLLALAIFLSAAATDLFDGYLARRWAQVTTIGTLLDPIADKLLISAALIALVQVHAVPGYLVILIIGREFAVSGLRSIAAAEGYTIAASDLGKTKMISQVIAVSCVLLGLRQFPAFRQAGIIGMWAVVVFALASAIQYFRKFWKHIDERVKQRRRRELMRQAKRERIAARRQKSETSSGLGVRT